jgi:hypothetical protein
VKEKISFYKNKCINSLTGKNLFTNGLWTTYNASDIKHANEEQRKFDGVIKGDYDFKEKKEKVFLITHSS